MNNKSLIFTQFNKARACAQFDSKRLGRALGIIQNGEPRPYNTTINACDCPDSNKGNICKHRIARMIVHRAFEDALKTAQAITITDKVFVDRQEFPIERALAAQLIDDRFVHVTGSNYIAYRRTP